MISVDDLLTEGLNLSSHELLVSSTLPCLVIAVTESADDVGFMHFRPLTSPPKSVFDNPTKLAIYSEQLRHQLAAIGAHAYLILTETIVTGPWDGPQVPSTARAMLMVVAGTKGNTVSHLHEIIRDAEKPVAWVTEAQDMAPLAKVHPFHNLLQPLFSQKLH